MAEDRAQRAANNKSLRIIKNELEALAERGFITDDQYDKIVSSLPAEASLSRPTPSATPSNTLDSSLAAMSVNDTRSVSPAPPSYQTAAQQQAPPPPPPTEHKEVAHAVALWRYATPDARDLNMEPGDHISVKEFVNAEWWLGTNARTREEGIFPSNYIRRENYPSPLAQAQPQTTYYGDQKYPPQQQQQYQQPQQQYQPQQYQQPGPSNPYANPVPPMAIAQGGEQQQQPAEEKPNKGMEMGKKIGGKLGNAALFGAGATIGGNIVNSIF